MGDRGSQQRGAQPPILLAGSVHQPPGVARVRPTGRVDQQPQQPLGLGPTLDRVLLVHLARHVREIPDPVRRLVTAADAPLGQRLQQDLDALATLVADPQPHDVDRALERIGVA
jgi:hypothetical protein